MVLNDKKCFAYPPGQHGTGSQVPAALAGGVDDWEMRWTMTVRGWARALCGWAG